MSIKAIGNAAGAYGTFAGIRELVITGLLLVAALVSNIFVGGWASWVRFDHNKGFPGGLLLTVALVLFLLAAGNFVALRYFPAYRKIYGAKSFIDDITESTKTTNVRANAQ